MKTSRGFTLLELSIVLILLGVISMMGLNTFVQIIRSSKDLKQKQENESIMRPILSYVQSHGKLPAQTDFNNIISGKRDIFGNNYTFMTSTLLDNETICAYNGATDFTLRFCNNAACDDNVTINNVSFLLTSHGANALNNTVVTNTAPQLVDLFLSNDAYDDISEYYSLLELQAAAQCGSPENKYSIRFITDTIPPINKNKADNADFGLLAVTSADTDIYWCVTNFTDIANFSDSGNIEIQSGQQRLYLRNNCSDSANYDLGGKHLNIRTLRAATGSDAPKIASFDVHVRDSRSTSITKTFFYQLFDNPR